MKRFDSWLHHAKCSDFAYKRFSGMAMASDLSSRSKTRLDGSKRDCRLFAVVLKELTRIYSQSVAQLFES